MPKIDFPLTSFASLEFQGKALLSQVLTASNSPILFGCRTGICGTCLCRVENLDACELPEASADEREVLDLIASDEPNARLACQIVLDRDLVITKIDEDA